MNTFVLVEARFFFLLLFEFIDDENFCLGKVCQDLIKILA